MARTIGIVAGLIGLAAVAALALSGPDRAETRGTPPLLTGTATAPVLAAPTVALKDARVAASSTIELRGAVAPNGFLTTYWFEYSADPRLGAVLIRATPRIALKTATGTIPVSVTAVNLMPSTTYYYRLAAENAGGISRSEPRSILVK